MIEDVQRLLIGVILVVVFIVIMSQLFAQPECEDMAKKTMSQVANGINQAAYLPVSSGEPSIQEQNKYIAVPIRFCQSSNIWTEATLAWGGAWPDWTLMYQKMPEGNFFWFEELPWSGGVGQQLIFTAVLRIVPAGIKAAVVAKYAEKIASWKAAIKGILGVTKYPAKILILFRKILKETGQEAEAESAVARAVEKPNIFGGIRNLFSTVLDKIDPEAAKVAEQTGKTPNRLVGWFKARWYAAGEVVDSEVIGELNPKKALGRLGIAKTAYVVDEETGAIKVIPSKLDTTTLLTLNYWLDTLPADDAKYLRQTMDVPSVYWGRLKNWILNKWQAGREARLNNPIYSWTRDQIHAVLDQIGYIPTDRKTELGITLKQRLRFALRTYLADETENVREPIRTKSLMSGLFADARKNPEKYLEAFGTNNPVDVLRVIDNTENLFKSHGFFMAAPDGTWLNRIDDLESTFQTGVIKNTRELELPPGEIDLEKYLGGDFNNAHGIDLSGLTANQRAAWNNLPIDVRSSFTTYVKSMGFDESDASRLWGVAKNGYFNNFGMGRGTEGMQGAYNALELYYTKKFVRGGGPEAQHLIDAARGSYETRPIVRVGANIIYPRAQRFIMYDSAIMGSSPINYPYWYGAGQTRQQADKLTANLNTDPSNALLLAKKGVSIEAMTTLSKDVADAGGVAIWRPKPGWLQRGPIGVQTSLLQIFIPENPSFYTVSPCFAIAKIWKGPDHIYVSMTGDVPDGTKCKVGDEACAYRSYCYADNDRIWGPGWESGGNDLLDVFGESWGAYIATLGACTALSEGAGAKECMQPAAKVAQTVAVGNALGHAATDQPCNDNYWSFWQYTKAGDICDFFGTFLSGTGPSPTKSEGWQARIGSSVKNYFKSPAGFMTDVCMVPTMVGYPVSYWTNIGVVKVGLNESQIRENQGNCLWTLGAPT